MLKVFIYSDMETAVNNIVDLYGVSVKEAVKIIEKTDKERSDTIVTTQAGIGQMRKTTICVLIPAT